MARFGQGFIQALTNPSYQQGLFTAAQSVGAAPGVAAEKERRQGMMNQILQAGEDPIKLAEVQSRLATTPQALLEAQQNLATLKKNQLKAQGEQSISVAQRVFASEENPENLASLTRSIEQLALQTGNDPIEAVSNARDARKTTLETKEAAIKEGFKTAYYASLGKPEQNTLLLDNMRKSGFSDLALNLETQNEEFIRLRDTNEERQNENKPLTAQEIEKLKAQVALIADAPTKKRYEAAVDTLSVTAKTTPSKARQKFGQLLIDIAKISPEKPVKEETLPDPSKDEITLATDAINQRRSNAPFSDETALGSVVIDEKEVLIDDILDGDVEGVSVDEADLARIVAAQQKQNPEITIDVAIKRAIESLVLGKKIATQAVTTSDSDDVVEYGDLQ
jgi:hypothetical protein